MPPRHLRQRYAFAMAFRGNPDLLVIRPPATATHIGNRQNLNAGGLRVRPYGHSIAGLQKPAQDGRRQRLTAHLLHPRLIGPTDSVCRLDPRRIGQDDSRNRPRGARPHRCTSRHRVGDQLPSRRHLGRHSRRLISRAICIPVKNNPVFRLRIWPQPYGRPELLPFPQTERSYRANRANIM